MSISITMPEATKTYIVKGKRKISDDLISGWSGIYVFRDSENSVLYVGKSKDLNRRINEHLMTVPYPFDNRAFSVTVYIESDPMSVDIYEAFMINELNPEYNKAGVYTEEFQRRNSEELYEFGELLIEAEDEERMLKVFIDDLLEDVDENGGTYSEELLEATYDLRRVQRRIARLKREIALRRRRRYGWAA